MIKEIDFTELILGWLVIVTLILIPALLVLGVLKLWEIIQ